MDKNAPCPCGSGLKFKKCCRKADVEPAELALAEEEAAERKAAVAALKAEREAQLEAMRQEAAKREAELAAQTASKTPETSEPAGDAFEFTEVDMSWDDVPEGLYGSSDEEAADAPVQEESDQEQTTDDV